jgi:hypothetical protein
MQVRISRIWHIIVYNNVDPLNINSPTDQIGSHKNPLVSFLEVLVSGQPIKATVRSEEQLKREHKVQMSWTFTHRCIDINPVKKINYSQWLHWICQHIVMLRARNELETK